MKNWQKGEGERECGRAHTLRRCSNEKRENDDNNNNYRLEYVCLCLWAIDSGRAGMFVMCVEHDVAVHSAFFAQQTEGNEIARTKCLPSHNNLFIYGSTFACQCRRHRYTCKFTADNVHLTPYQRHRQSSTMTTSAAGAIPSRQTMQLVKTSCSSIYFPPFVRSFRFFFFPHFQFARSSPV